MHQIIDENKKGTFIIYCLKPSSHIRRYKYEYKINQLRKMIEKEVGRPVSLKRSPTGSLEITPELLKEVPNIEQ